MTNRLIGTGSWAIQAKLIEEEDDETTFVLGGKTFDLKDNLKRYYSATFNSKDKTWSFVTNQDPEKVVQQIQDWMDQNRADARERYRETKQRNCDCDCWLGASGKRISREPGKAFCTLAGRNDRKEECEKQEENFALYKKRNRKDDRWSSYHNVECPACGLNLFSSSKHSYYTRYMDSCFHCEWNISCDD